MLFHLTPINQPAKADPKSRDPNARTLLTDCRKIMLNHHLHAIMVQRVLNLTPTPHTASASNQTSTPNALAPEIPIMPGTTAPLSQSLGTKSLTSTTGAPSPHMPTHDYRCTGRNTRFPRPALNTPSPIPLRITLLSCDKRMMLPHSRGTSSGVGCARCCKMACATCSCNEVYVCRRWGRTEL